MEIDRIIYKAKDGRIFFDPIECEEYEKTIGVLPGSVGDFLNELDKNTNDADYIFGIVKMMDGDKGIIYMRCTVCVDRLLEDYVNVENLTEEKRYFVSTAGELKNTLKQVNKDLPCQYFIVFSSDMNFKVSGAMSNHNNAAWSKDSKK